MTVAVMRSYFLKQAPALLRYRSYKYFENSIFRIDLQTKLNEQNHKIDYNQFENIFMEVLDKHAPMKEKYICDNNGQFMNKILSKAIMNRSQLRNKFLKHPDVTNRVNYTKQRNYCVNILKREKKKYYNTLNIENIVDNKTFWKTIKPLFSEKCKNRKKITLIEADRIITLK